MNQEFTEADAEAAIPVLTQIGGPAATGFKSGDLWKGNKEGRPKTPESLKEVLLAVLTPTIRRKLALSLVDLALHAESERARLSAIIEIYDRIEGRARVADADQDGQQNPILLILERVMTEHQAQITEGEIVRVIDDGPGALESSPKTQVRSRNRPKPRA